MIYHIIISTLSLVAYYEAEVIARKNFTEKKIHFCKFSFDKKREPLHRIKKMLCTSNFNDNFVYFFVTPIVF